MICRIWRRITKRPIGTPTRFGIHERLKYSRVRGILLGHEKSGSVIVTGLVMMMIVMPLLAPIPSITSTVHIPLSSSILLMVSSLLGIWAEFHKFPVLMMTVVIMIMVVMMMMVIVVIMMMTGITATCPVNALQHFVRLFRLRWPSTIIIAMLVAITIATCCAAHCTKVSTWACEIIGKIA